jgi:hypothetical protein
VQEDAGLIIELANTPARALEEEWGTIRGVLIFLDIIILNYLPVGSL